MTQLSECKLACVIMTRVASDIQSMVKQLSGPASNYACRQWAYIAFGQEAWPEGNAVCCRRQIQIVDAVAS